MLLLASLCAIALSGVDHAIVVSVDGLRPELLAPGSVGEFPGFARLLRGPHTLAARCDPSTTVTLPNHVGMVTGRLFAGERGHGWLGNVDPPKPGAGGTIEEMHGSYVPSMFDVASDRGVATGVFAEKTKFVLLDQSYSETTGAPDATGADDGRDKIDLFEARVDGASVALEALRFLRACAHEQRRSLSLVHFAATDSAGHAHTWDLRPDSEYWKAAKAIDRIIDALLTILDADPALHGRVGIVLTTDHGGGDPPATHTTLTAPVNFTIPLAVWRGRDEAARDLYELNAATRAPPAPTENSATAAPPPIRNADAGNLALELLGLPPIEPLSADGRAPLVLDGPRGTSGSP